MKKQLLPLIILLLLPALIVKAQLGSGWTEKFPTHYVHEENGTTDRLVSNVSINNIYTDQPVINGDYATYSRIDGVETFTLRKNPSGSRQRVEARVENGYSSGIHQFDGEVWIKSGSGGTSGNSGPDAAVCVHQVWQWIMVIVFNLNNGDLRQHSNNNLITNAYEKWVRVTTIHDYNNGRAQVWVDGVKKFDGTTDPNGTNDGYNNSEFYHKYGIYNGAGTNPLVKWRNIRYFEGGSLPSAKTPQKITLASTMTKSVGDADFSPATSNSGLGCTYKSLNTSVATIVNGKIHIVGKGTAIIEAYQNGNTTYSAACKQFTKLTVTDAPQTTWYKIKVVNNPTYVLNGASTTPANGTNVNVYTSSTSNAQLWQMVDVGSGYVKIVPYTNTNYALDCSTTPANGVNVQLWSYSGNTRQQWLVSDLGSGYKKITVRADANYTLDCSTTPANNINVQMWTYAGNNRQQWILEPVLKSQIVNNETSSNALALECTPNPITDQAKINYTIDKAGLAKLAVYNAYGQKVKELATGFLQPGNYNITFRKDNLPEGLYFIKLTSGPSENIAKVIIR